MVHVSLVIYNLAPVITTATNTLNVSYISFSNIQVIYRLSQAGPTGEASLTLLVKHMTRDDDEESKDMALGQF